MTSPIVIRLDVPADILYLGLVTCSLNELIMTQSLAEPELISHNIQLAVHEVCMNIIEHAYANEPGGRIALTLTIEPPLGTQARRLIIELCDTGAHSFDPAAIAAPDLDVPQVGGYGLFLVQNLMDEVQYDPQPNDHRWRLVKYLEN